MHLNIHGRNDSPGYSLAPLLLLAPQRMHKKKYQKPRVMINVLLDILIHWAQNVFHLFTAKLYSPMVKLVNLVGLTWVVVIARKNYPRNFSGP